MIAAAVSLWWLVEPPATRLPDALPADLEFTVSLDALAERRSASGAEAAGAGDTAYPETLLTLVVEPRENGVAGLEFGLYVERERRLERRRPGRRLTLEVDRGTATFEALAGDLLGDRPGTYSLFVVVAVAGHLPEEQRLDPGEDAETALGAGSPFHRVYRKPITLLPPSPEAR